MKHPVIGLCAVLALGGLISTPLAARPPTNADPDLAPWFQAQVFPWTEGGQSGLISCCGAADGHMIGDNQWRQAADGHYEVQTPAGWIPVSPDRVQQPAGQPGQGNPTGSAVAFWQDGDGTFIFCFRLPYEG